MTDSADEPPRSIEAIDAERLMLAAQIGELRQQIVVMERRLRTLDVEIRARMVRPVHEEERHDDADGAG